MELYDCTNIDILNLNQTATLFADSYLDTLFQFRLPAGRPSGSYALRLVVYDVESLVPTVQVGVWEPEVTFEYEWLEDSD